LQKFAITKSYTPFSVPVKIRGIARGLTPAAEFDGGSDSASSAIQQFGAVDATGRAWNLEDAMCIFQVS
jgi:hypothetical protein